ncbi:hypothetical protein QR680_016265 [Steinernema hermaphroditum]|uniref:Uncharacterized protein n=1 Tax=Steinernema hermaphroditum TaxID=289476 RepID=A0AA39HAM6_9BILA|nr:hypothetical protein QR680_016265 [Steinernema hermaphroditum]
MVLVLTPSMSPLGVFSYFFFLNAAAATTYPVTFYSGDLNKGPQVFVAPELTVFIAITDDSNDDTSSLISMAVGDGEARLVNSYVSGACGTTTASSQTVVIALNDHLLDESQSQSVVFYVIDKKLDTTNLLLCSSSPELSNRPISYDLPLIALVPRSSTESQVQISSIEITKGAEVDVELLSYKSETELLSVTSSSTQGKSICGPVLRIRPKQGTEAVVSAKYLPFALGCSKTTTSTSTTMSTSTSTSTTSQPITTTTSPKATVPSTTTTIRGTSATKHISVAMRKSTTSPASSSTTTFGCGTPTSCTSTEIQSTTEHGNGASTVMLHSIATILFIYFAYLL